MRELIRTIRTYAPQTVGIEKRKGDAIFYSFQEARTRLNLWDFKYVELQTHGKGKWDSSRIGGMVARWEGHTIHIHPEMKLLRGQLYAYRPDDKSKEHDDLVDALAWCFHPDMAIPNTGRENVPYDVLTASAEGKPRYSVGRETWREQEPHEWAMSKAGLDRRVYENV